MGRKLTVVSFLFELTDDSKTRQWDGLFSKRFLAAGGKKNNLMVFFFCVLSVGILSSSFLPGTGTISTDSYKPASPGITAPDEPKTDNQTQVNAAINRVRDSLNRIKPFKVNFIQQVYTDEEADLKETGEILFESNQRLKWTYLEPDYKIFLLEGDHYRFYDEDNEQLLIGKVKDRGRQWVWQMLFSDGLTRHYLVTWDEHRKTLHIKNRVPTPAGNDTGSDLLDIEIVMNDDNLPEKVLQEDPSGARIIYFFKDYKPKIEISPETFRLKVPEEVEIIREES